MGVCFFPRLGAPQGFSCAVGGSGLVVSPSEHFIGEAGTGRGPPMKGYLDVSGNQRAVIRMPAELIYRQSPIFSSVTKSYF